MKLIQWLKGLTKKTKIISAVVTGVVIVGVGAGVAVGVSKSYEHEDYHKHDYAAVITEATCEEDGYTTYTCVCGDSYKADYVKARGRHGLTKWVFESETTTCTEGYVTNKICVDCNKVLDTYTGMAKGHRGDWVVVKEATCTTNGVEKQVCTICAEVSEREISKEHCGDWVVVKDATCTENGLRQQICTECSKVLREIEIKAEHKIEKEIVRTTSTVKGWIIYKCQFCEYTYKEDFEAIRISFERTNYFTDAWINGFVGDLASFSINAEGGYGEYQYYFEVYRSLDSNEPNLIEDFSEENSITIQSIYSSLEEAVLKVVVKDDYGNESCIWIDVSEATELDLGA